MSGLYFRGKATYAAAFARPPAELPGALVISPSAGLCSLDEQVTLERLRAWASIRIDAKNPRFTAPLVEHASLLWRAYGESARYVLLGSIATDKYVKPLLEVFGADLLFPSAFVGRGDMSRGAMLLRAARAGLELEYEPVAGATRHGRRAPRISAEASPRRVVSTSSDVEGPEVVILVGLPGAGKSTFARERFAEQHVVVSMDRMRGNRRPRRRQLELVRDALAAGRSVIVDNTNASPDERAELIAVARRHGARVTGYFFEVSTRESVARNARREGRERVPEVGIFATAKRLVSPQHAEGFDALYAVRPEPPAGFAVRPLPRPAVTARASTRV